MDDRLTVPVLALLIRHFTSRYGVRDDLAHLDTYAEGAFLVVGDQGLRRAEAGRDAVLAAWAGVPTDREPQFVAPTLVDWRPDGETRGVTIVDLREAVTGTPVLAAAGVVLEGDEWRLDWLTLVDDERPIAYERQRMAALAELASLGAMSRLGPLTSLLEVAWARRMWLPKQRLLALPETRFSCAGTGSCCRHALTIGLDDNSATFVGAVDWPSLVPGLGEGPYTETLPAMARNLGGFGVRLAREADGRCRFLSADNRCNIHALAGRAVFKPCHVFPYRFAATPDGICVTTHSMCPTARFGRGAPLAEQEGELRSRLAVADVLRAERYRLRPGEDVDWEVFKTVEGQLLELLNGDAPIKRKIWVALRWLEQRLADPGAGVDPVWYTEPMPRAGWVTRLAFRRFGANFDPCFKDLRGVEAGEGLLPEHEAELTRFFRAFLFGKATTFPYGLVVGLNYLALVHHLLERQAGRHGRKGLSEAFWREFYAVITSGTFLRVLKVCHETHATMLARSAATPSFGLNMLRL